MLFFRQTQAAEKTAERRDCGNKENGGDTVKYAIPQRFHSSCRYLALKLWPQEVFSTLLQLNYHVVRQKYGYLHQMIEQTIGHQPTTDTYSDSTSKRPPELMKRRYQSQNHQQYWALPQT